MAETGKKVDVRYGAFACTIEGYDNPVEQLQLILGEMQKMIAETPQFSKIGTGDEADEIKEALNPQSDGQDGSPGIVVIRDSEAQPVPQSTARVSPDPVTDAEEVEQPDASEVEEDSEDQTSRAGETAPQTSIFEAPFEAEPSDSESAPEPSETVETPAPSDDEQESFIEQHATAIAGTAAAAIGAAILSKDDETADHVVEAESVEDAVADVASANAAVSDSEDDAFSDEGLTSNEAEPGAESSDDPWSVAQVDDAPETSDSEAPSQTVAQNADDASDDDHDDTAATADQTREEAVTPDEAQDVWTGDLEPEVEPVEAPLAEPKAFSIFADPEPEEAVAQAEPETPLAEPGQKAQVDAAPVSAAPVNIFANPDDEVAVAPEPEVAQAPEPTPEPEMPSEPKASPNIFATPEPEAAPSVNIFADPEDHAADEVQKPEAVEPAAQLAEDTAISPDEQPTTDWSNAGAATAVAAATATAAINIFADPDPEPEDTSETTSPLDAISEALAEPVDAIVAQTPVEEAVNIFANPDADPIAAIADEIEEAEQETASVWDTASETLSNATPDTVRQTLDDLGARLSQAADTSTEPATEEPAAQQVDASVASIFAAPPEPQEDRVQIAPAPAPPPQTTQGSRFESLLNQVHGSPVMGAPGEPEANATTVQEPSPELASGIGSASDLAQRAGSESVSDLLAASAAWLTLAEGKSRFSRRDVMDVFEQIPGDHPRTLEARIKGYGRLVRSGMLVLVDDGVFAMAQTERDRFQTILDRT